jgi:hypothetical protein
MTKLAEAINLYNLNAQWVIEGDNYETLDWHSTDIAKPTLEQLEALLSQIDAAKAQAEAEAAAKKAAAEAKLAALGLTADDLKALGLGGN